MNEEYLKGLHGHLGVEDDYGTWVSAIQNDEEYLKGLHGHLGVEDDYDTWSNSVFGGKQSADSTDSPSVSAQEASTLDIEQGEEETGKAGSSSDVTVASAFNEATQREIPNEPPVEEEDTPPAYDESLAALYDAYKETGKITEQDELAAAQTVTDQLDPSKRSLVENINAYATGFAASGQMIPLYKYTTSEELLNSKKQRSKINFLADLPEEKVEELNEYATNRAVELNAVNKNTIAETVIIDEKTKSVIASLKEKKRVFEHMKSEGILSEVTDKLATLSKEEQKAALNDDFMDGKFMGIMNVVEDINSGIEQLKSLNMQRNSNIDFIEANTEDLGEFYEELDLLKRNYGGLDYYSDLTRLATAEMIGGLGEMVGSIPVLGTPNIELQLKSAEFRHEVNEQREFLRPAMSIDDIDGAESLGMWMAEQVANQIPVLTVLAASGGTAGLGVLGASAGGSKIGELRDAKRMGESDLNEYQIVLAGMGVGALEAISERVSLGILSKGRRAISSGIKAGRTGTIKGGAGKFVGDLFQATYGEGTSEFGNTIGQNLISIALGEDVHLFDGAGEALASGAFMGKAMHLAPAIVGGALRTFMPLDDATKVSRMAKEAEAVMAELQTNKDLNEATKQILEAKLETLLTDAKGVLTDNMANLPQIGKKNITRLIEIEKAVKKIRQAAKETDESNLKETTKKEVKTKLKEQLDTLKEEKEEVISKAKGDGNKQNEEGVSKGTATTKTAETTETKTDGATEGGAKVQKEDGAAQRVDGNDNSVRGNRDGDTKDAQSVEAEIEQSNIDSTVARAVEAAPTLKGMEVTAADTKLIEAVDKTAEVHRDGYEPTRYEKAAATRAWNKMSKKAKELGVPTDAYYQYMKNSPLATPTSDSQTVETTKKAPKVEKKAKNTPKKKVEPKKEKPALTKDEVAKKIQALEEQIVDAETDEEAEALQDEVNTLKGNEVVRQSKEVIAETLKKKKISKADKKAIEVANARIGLVKQGKALKKINAKAEAKKKAETKRKAKKVEPKKKKKSKKKDVKSSVEKEMLLKFDLDSPQAEAVAEVADILIANMAEQAGITKEEMADKIEFQKSEKAPDGSLRQDAPKENHDDRIVKKSLLGLDKLKNLQNSAPAVWIKKIVEAGGKNTQHELNFIKFTETLTDFAKVHNLKTLSHDQVLGLLKGDKKLAFETILAMPKDGTYSNPIIKKRNEDLQDAFMSIRAATETAMDTFESLEEYLFVLDKNDMAEDYNLANGYYTDLVETIKSLGDWALNNPIKDAEKKDLNPSYTGIPADFVVGFVEAYNDAIDSAIYLAKEQVKEYEQEIANIKKKGTVTQDELIKIEILEGMAEGMIKSPKFGSVEHRLLAIKKQNISLIEELEFQGERKRKLAYRFNEYDTPSFSMKGGREVPLSRREVIITAPNLKQTDIEDRNQNTKHYQHIDEPIVVHSRTSVRRIQDKKILFIEEIQSDWSQDNRDFGTNEDKLSEQDIDTLKKGEVVDSQLEALRDRLDGEMAKYNEVRAELKDLEKQQEKNFESAAYDANEAYERGEISRSRIHFLIEKTEKASELGQEIELTKERLKEAKKAAERTDSQIDLFYDRNTKIMGAVEAIKNRGFKSPHMKSEHFVGLMVRKLMKIAVEEGLDGIAMTTGEQQAHRWRGMENPEGLKAFYNKMIPSIISKELKAYDKSVKLGVLEFLKPHSEKDALKEEKAVYDKVYNEFYEKLKKRYAKDFELVESVKKGTKTDISKKDLESAEHKIRHTEFIATKEGDSAVRKKYGTSFTDMKYEVEFHNTMSERLKKRGKKEGIPNNPEYVDKQLGFMFSDKIRMKTQGAVPLFQNSQGAMTHEDGKFIVHAITNPNVSTPLHELAHVYEKFLSEEDRAIVEAWAETEGGWTVETSEKFARGFEKFLAEGKVKNPALQEVFEKFKAWLTDIYNGIKNSDIDIELNPAMEAIYEKMISPVSSTRAINKKVNELHAEGLTLNEVLKHWTNPSHRMVAKNAYIRLQPKPKGSSLAKAKASFEKAEAKAREKKKTPFTLRTIRNLAKYVWDRQYLPKRILMQTGGKIVRNYMVASKGAPGYAKYLFDKAYDKIYKSLSDSDIKTLDLLIIQRRFIAIDENRAKRGLDPVTHPDFQNIETAKETLEELKNEIGKKKFDDLNKRADNYFASFKELLDNMEQSGLVTKKFRDDFFDVDYQPRVFLHFLTTQEQENSILEMGAPVSTSLSNSAIETMERGSDEALVVDSMYLLARAMNVRAKTSSMNLTVRRLNNFMKEQKALIDTFDMRNLTKEQKEIVQAYETLSKSVKYNPIIGFSKKGKPKYEGKPKANQKVQSFWVDGIKHQMIMEEQFHDQFNDSLKAIWNNSDVREKVVLASGTALVKGIATGHNPTFFLTNTPRDLVFIATFSEEYGSFLLTNLLKVAKDFVGAVKDIKSDSKSFNNFVKYGGMLDFLHTQGTFKGTKGINRIIEANTQNKTRKIFGKVFDAGTFEFLQKYSEMGFRVGVFNRSVKNQLGKMKVKDINTLTDEQQRDIYINAVTSARQTTDFNQGGTVVKDLDALIPYLNAGVQGTRMALENLHERPFETSWRMVQASIIIAALPMLFSKLFISAVNWDDDEEMRDLTDNARYLKLMEYVSKYDRVNYQIVFTGGRNEDGEPNFIRISKPHFLTPMSAYINTKYANIYREQQGLKPLDPLEDVKFALAKNVSPIDASITANIARNPMLKAAMTYTLGYDFYREQDLSYVKGKVEIAAEGFESKGVEAFYKTLGEQSGMSPARFKGAVESLITTPSTSPFVGLLYGGLDTMIGNEYLDSKMAGVQRDVSKTLMKSVTGRFYKTGSKYNLVTDWDKTLKEVFTAEDIKQAKISLQASVIIKEAKLGNKSDDEVVEELTKLSGDDSYTLKRLLGRFKTTLGKPDASAFTNDLAWRSPYEKVQILLEVFGDDLLNEKSNMQKSAVEELFSNKVLDKETLFKYLEAINKK